MKAPNILTSHKQGCATPIKYLALMVSFLLLPLPAQAAESNQLNKVGDLQIYKLPDTGGAPTIMLMLDTSYSMGKSSLSSGQDGAECIGRAEQLKGTNNIYYCDIPDPSPSDSSKTKRIFDRVTRLREAVNKLMDSDSLNSNVKVGLAHYPAGDHYGQIIVPAKPLDATQRAVIKQKVNGLRPRGQTPSAVSYADGGAYLLGTSTSKGARNQSGFWHTGVDNIIRNSSQYIAPGTGAGSSCSGTGFYFLTDGLPNNSVPSNTLKMMQQALNDPSFTCSGMKNYSHSPFSPLSTDENSGWDCIASFSKELRKKNIRTAVVGFGSSFSAVNNPANYKEELQTLQNGTTYKKRYYDCSKLEGAVQNACNWGMESGVYSGVGGFGEGGFYFANDVDDIVNSILSFAGTIKTKLTPSPSGTIMVPDDPYRADSQMAVAYFPMLDPQLGSNVMTWPGNVKKYELNEGTLYGKNDTKLFLDAKGTLNPSAQDLWSDKNYTDNSAVTSGGFYSQLKDPKSGIANVRTVYIEDNKKLKKFGVNSAGKVTLDANPLSSTNTFEDKSVYTEDKLRYLLNFLGFDKLPTGNVQDMTLKAEHISKPIRVVGASYHSNPVAVSYSAELDNDGQITDERDDYVLFGSSEGALHLINADDYKAGNDGGKEKFAFIPQKMLHEQPSALQDEATGRPAGQPVFGIDAPWMVKTTYKYDFANKKVTVDSTNGGVKAYGGLRMGGEAFYGLNLTNKDNPSLLFAITSSMSNFSRMGQIWSKPTKAKIKMSSSDTGTDVLVFGGGYDTCYNNDHFQVGAMNTGLVDLAGNSCEKNEARGNAVYIINADTGNLIWSASSSAGASTSVSNMKNSVVGEITVLDRDNDGFMDHIYFADLGGQVFRADFTNAGFKKPVKTGSPTAESSFSNTRVVRVLQPAFSNDANTKKYALRFYERPVVSFYRGTDNKIFALVNIISGDRSSPLSEMRSDNTYADRVYGIIDRDITKLDSELYQSDFKGTLMSGGKEGLTDSELANLPTDIGPTITQDKKQAQLNLISSGAKKGWYYPLTRFDGYANVKYGKGVGKSVVINNYLYTTVYNPDMTYNDDGNSCSAKILGGSERQLYCLPYGICLDDTSKTGTGGFIPAGPGIQELTLGPRSSKVSNQRLLIGMRTLAERASDSRVNYNVDALKNNSPIKKAQGAADGATQVGGDGSAAEFIFNERYTLQPKVWYEVNADS